MSQIPISRDSIDHVADQICGFRLSVRLRGNPIKHIGTIQSIGGAISVKSEIVKVPLHHDIEREQTIGETLKQPFQKGYFMMKFDDKGRQNRDLICINKVNQEIITTVIALVEKSPLISFETVWIVLNQSHLIIMTFKAG